MTFRSAGFIETILIKKVYLLGIFSGSIFLLFYTGKWDRVSAFRWIRPGRYTISIKNAYLIRVRNQKTRRSLLLSDVVHFIKILIVTWLVYTRNLLSLRYCLSLDRVYIKLSFLNFIAWYCGGAELLPSKRRQLIDRFLYLQDIHNIYHQRILLSSPRFIRSIAFYTHKKNLIKLFRLYYYCLVRSNSRAF